LTGHVARNVEVPIGASLFGIMEDYILAGNIEVGIKLIAVRSL
jgi:hypothetical protein